nr:transposase [uncultured Desulfuromonas sp.]
MSRPLRIEFAGAFYHVTARGNERKKIFVSQRDYARFKDYLGIARERFGCVLHAYVLMGNHYHLLLETPEANLSKVMHYVNGSYTTYFNVKRKRSGHLFQGRYKSIVVDRDNYLLELSRYIHLNPVRAGIKERPEEYPHSSYGSYIGQGADDLVCRKEVLALLTDERTKAADKYREYVESALDQETVSPLEKLYGGFVLGRERFVREILQRLSADQVEREDVSYRKSLQVGHRVEDIIQRVCAHHVCSPQDLNKKEYRHAQDMAIYLLKRQTAAANREIGEMFDGLSYSAVAKICQRFGKRLQDHRGLSLALEELSRVKG